MQTWDHAKKHKQGLFTACPRAKMPLPVSWQPGWEGVLLDFPIGLVAADTCPFYPPVMLHTHISKCRARHTMLE